MAGRFFDFGNSFGDSSDPWFRVGKVDVTTTMAVVAAGVISMFIWAIEGARGPIFKSLWLLSDDLATALGTGSVQDGQVWRLITWPIPNEPDFWTVILFAFFFIFGSQIERVMGRKPFLWFLVIVTVVPALILTVLDAATGLTGGAAGLRFLQLGVLTAWAAQYPTARFFGIIPAPIGVGVIIGIDVLQAVGLRDNFGLILVLATVAVALVAFRSFGHAPDVPQIPKLPLPAFMTGQGGRSVARTPKPSRRRRRGRGNLRAVPPPTPAGPKYRTSSDADAEMDALLDQVAEAGYDSLTDDQKRRLQQHSKRLRDGRED